MLFNLFQARPDKLRGPWCHKITMTDDAGKEVGYIRWHWQTGETEMIRVKPQFHRQGHATELWARAWKVSDALKLAPPVGSIHATKAGRAFYDSLVERGLACGCDTHHITST